MIDLDRCQAALATEGLDGWLLYDFKGLNPIAVEAVLPPGGHHTRRWFCFVPREGAPRWLVHAIERAGFADVPGSVATYAGRASLGRRFRCSGTTPSKVSSSSIIVGTTSASVSTPSEATRSSLGNRSCERPRKHENGWRL